MGLTADVTGRQEMLAPPGHLIPPLVSVNSFISLTCNSLCFETDHSLVSLHLRIRMKLGNSPIYFFSTSHIFFLTSFTLFSICVSVMCVILDLIYA